MAELVLTASSGAAAPAPGQQHEHRAKDELVLALAEPVVDGEGVAGARDHLRRARGVYTDLPQEARSGARPGGIDAGQLARARHAGEP
jgi:hypothetical protein